MYICIYKTIYIYTYRYIPAGPIALPPPARRRPRRAVPSQQRDRASPQPAGAPEEEESFGEPRGNLKMNSFLLNEEGVRVIPRAPGWMLQGRNH